jgi:hypothetical protein
MIKAAFSFILTAIVLIVAALYIAYGEVEPCRVLAVEEARRSDNAGLVTGAIESLTRASTSQMSTSECVSRLLDSWGERLKGD